MLSVRPHPRAVLCCLATAALLTFTTACSGTDNTDGTASAQPTTSPTTPASSPTPTTTEPPTTTPTQPSDVPSSTDTSPSPSTSPTNSATPAGKLLDYRDLNNGDGAFIVTDADLEQIKDAPADFKAFVSRKAAKAAADCPEAAHGITVNMVRTDGFAVGAVNSCGGYVALWARTATTGNKWKQIIGTQDAWACAPLRKHKVPSVLVDGRCFDYSGDRKEHEYDQP